MKAEEKAKVVEVARVIAERATGAKVLVTPDAKVTTSPDCYWVQAWVKVASDFEVPKK